VKLIITTYVTFTTNGECLLSHSALRRY